MLYPYDFEKNEKENEDEIKNQKTFTQRQCQQKVKIALLEMKGGYDFEICTENISKKDKNIKYFKTVIYTRHQCYKCLKGKKSNNGTQKKRRWTTSAGTCMIRYKIQKIQDKQLRFPFLITLNLKIYKMKCRICKGYGWAQLYDSQLEKVQNMMQAIISSILHGKNIPKKPRNLNPIPVPNLKNHQISLCEACQKGVCIYSTRRKGRKNKENQRNNMHISQSQYSYSEFSNDDRNLKEEKQDNLRLNPIVCKEINSQKKSVMNNVKKVKYTEKIQNDQRKQSIQDERRQKYMSKERSIALKRL